MEKSLKWCGSEENLAHIVDICDIEELKNKEIKENFQSFRIAVSVEKQLLYLKKIVSKCNNDNMIDKIDEAVVYKIISKIYFSIDLRNPLKGGIIRMLSLSNDSKFEVMLSAFVNELKITINEIQLNINDMDLLNNKLIGCYENFPIGSRCVYLCQSDILNYILKCLTHSLNELRQPDLSPSFKSHIFQCIHSSIRLGVSTLQNSNDSASENLNNFISCIRKVLELDGLPLDTANNCGHLLSLHVKLTSQNNYGFIQLFDEYRQNNNKLLIIYISSGLLTTLSSEEMRANDYQILKMIVEELVTIYNRYSTDCPVILSLSRVFVVLSKCLLEIPETFIIVPDLNNFLINYTWTHLDHYMDSARHLSSTIINNIVKIASLLGSSSSEEWSLLNIILKKMVETPVWKRAKHAALQALADVIKSTEILASEPNLVKTLLTSLQQPCSPSYMINSIEKLMLKHLKEVDVEEWTAAWVSPLLETMINNNGRNFGLEKLLTKAICISPSIVNSILSQNDKCWTVAFSCLHSCRKLGLKIENDETSEKWQGLVNYSFFYEAMCHQSSEVRLSSFAVILESRKSTECFTKKELELIKEFLKYNINEYETGICREKLSFMNKLLIRIKDSSQVLMKKNNEIKSKSTNNSAAEYNTEMLNEYKKFYDWLISFCFDNLFPGSCRNRRDLALSTLTLFKTLFIWPDSGNTSSNARILLFCLTDSYEENKKMARNILVTMPAEILDFNKEDCVKQVFETCLKLGSSYRPPDCITAAYLLCVLIRFPETESVLSKITNHPLDKIGGGIQCALVAVKDKLVEELNVARKSLLAAAASGPLYGRLLQIRHILYETSLRIVCESPKWKELIGEIITLCFECSAAVVSVVSSDSPEGFLPVDISSDLCDGDNTEESENVNVTAQMILLCSWRTIKEVSLILGHLARYAPVSNDDEGLISEDQLISIGDHLTMLLAETKHRGAFEQAYIGFCNLAATLWRFPDGQLHKLPYKWLEETVEEIAVTDGKICATRRSAGIPYMVQGLVCTELTVGNGTCFTVCLKRLLDLSSSRNHSVDTRVHALNILRALFRNADLREAVSPYVQDAFIIAITGFKSPSWAERNSSTLLFSAMMTRVFGVKRTKGYDLNWKNKMTGRIFFQRYPLLYSFLLDQLSAKEINAGDLRPTLYPVLLLLSRLYPSSLEGTDSNLKLAEFVCPLIDCSGSSVMKTRFLSARAIVPLISTDKFVDHIDKLFQLIINAKQENFVHGLSLQIMELLKSEQMNNLNVEEIKIKLNQWIGLLVNFIDNKTHSFIVLSAFIQIINLLHVKFSDVINSWNDICSLLQFIIFNKLITCNSINDVIGRNQFETLLIDFFIKLKIFSICDCLNLIDVFVKIYYSNNFCYEIKNKVLDIILFLIYDKFNEFDDDDDEEFKEICQNYLKLNQLRKNQLKESILNNKQMISLIYDVLLDIDINNQRLNRFFNILSKFPKVFTFILQQKDGLSTFIQVKGIDENKDIYFLVMMFCNLPYEEIEVKNLLGKHEHDKQFICEIIVKFIYSNQLSLNPDVRLMIAKWYNSTFFHIITSTTLSSDIRLSLWSYLIMLCLDEDTEIQSVLCNTYCQEKTLEVTISKFLEEESDCFVKAVGLSAWILGSFQLDEDSNNSFYEPNEKPLDKDELESDYEELILSRYASTYLTQFILENPSVKSLEISNTVLTDWFSNHTRLPKHKEAKTLLNLFTIAENQVNDLNKIIIGDEYCIFLRYGYRSIKLFQMKLNCFSFKTILAS